MQKFRETNQIFWLSALVLIFSVGCAEEKKFEGRSKGSTNGGVAEPHTSREDDTPLQFPSMITASQFLMDCRALPSQKTSTANKLNVGCSVKSPVHAKFFKTMDWSVTSEKVHQSAAHITPSDADIRTAEISFSAGQQFPIRVMARVTLKVGMDPFEVIRTYADFKEFLPVAIPACEYRLKRIDTAWKFAKYLGGSIAQECYVGQINAYLQCNSAQPVKNPDC